MRRALVFFAVTTVILFSPILAANTAHICSDAVTYPDSLQQMGPSSTSSAGGTGTPADAVAIMTRSITGMDMGLYDTYTDSSHEFQLDLTSYLVSGWTLEEVVIESSAMTAAPERVSLNVDKNTDIRIWNDTVGSGYTYDGLYQSFYNLPHDGKLENYSITYIAPYYDPSNLGYAYLVVRSNYSSLSANVTSFVSPFTATFTELTITHDCSGDSAVLDASTPYYVVIDGTAMYGQEILGSWYFNEIFWQAQTTAGSATGYHIYQDAWYDYPPLVPREADLNYTYTPWNKTSGSALIYSSAEEFGLQGNGTALSGSSWSFTDTDNITLIDFSSTIAAEIQYDLKLVYTKSIASTTEWQVATSGGSVEWNITASIDYPVVSDIETRSLNLSVQSDWTTTGLYNTSNPGTSYEHYSRVGDTVVCDDLDDETWTLSLDAPNYVAGLDLTDSSSGSPIGSKVANTVNIDIDASIEDALSNPVSGGSANLTVLKQGISIYSPSEMPASSGTASFSWDISTSTTGNGTHSVEVYWSNGVEAGYRVINLFVYYSTALVPSASEVSAFAEDSFYISVDFDRLFPATGLDSSLGASLTYSFGSTINASLSDQTGGTWDATVSTAGLTNGTFSLHIYAEGYALENRSLVIPVYLTYQTQSLIVAWSNTNNISFLDTTNLTIDYRTASGAIPDALVNVTFQGSTYTMAWDADSEYYWITLTGSDFVGVPGTFLLNVSAWKAGYQSQYDDTIQLTINTQTGLFFTVEWPDSSTNFTFIDYFQINVTYDYDSSPVPGATVTAAFNGTDFVTLDYNPVAERWETVVYWRNYTLGTWNLLIEAGATGYQTLNDTTIYTVDADVASLTSSWTNDSEVTNYDTPVALNITLLDSALNPIDYANISVVVYGTPETMTFIGNGVYTVQIEPDDTREIRPVQVILSEYGYTPEILDLNLTVQATTTLQVNHVASEYEQWNLTVTAIYRDAVYTTPITDAIVNITIGGTTYPLTYTGGFYTAEIVLDFSPDDYAISCLASAPLAVAQSSETTLTIQAKEELNLDIGFGGNLVAGQLIEVRATLTSNETGLPISGVTILFEVSVRFANGTIVQIIEGSMSDVTNTEGVATIGVNVPDGQVESLSVQATFEGNRIRWPVSSSQLAEVQVNVLSLLIAFLLSDVGIMTIGAMIVLGVVAAAYNRTVKPRRKAAKKSLENQLQKFRDLQTIQHFMAVYVDRGTCVFYHPFKDERIEPDLISGFISAITSVYGEIKGDGVRGTLEEIQYHGLRLNSYSGEFIIGILILEGEMTPLLRDRLQFFVEIFENQYEGDLDRWNGVVDCFDPEWVVSTLNSAFNYSWHLPHRFGPTQKVSKTDAKILDYIGAVRDDRLEFYLKDLLTPLSEMLNKTEAETLDRLLSLQERGAIVPVGVQTILQRQGMGLANGEEVGDLTVMDIPKMAEAEEPIEKPDKEKPKREKPEEAPTPEEVSLEEAPTVAEEEKEAETEPVEESREEDGDPLDAFVDDVESLLKEDTTETEEEEDDLDKFVKDVESLLSEDKEESGD